MSSRPPLTLGDISDIEECPMCAGEGTQLETLWVPGEEPIEHEVECFQCRGRGHVVELVCGRCGEVEWAEPEDLAEDTHVCSMCGHQAPKFLWLPMRHVHTEKETG